MKIQVYYKNVYGSYLTYPVCEKAKLFAAMVGKKTLPPDVVEHIKKLGYTFEVVQDPMK